MVKSDPQAIFFVLRVLAFYCLMRAKCGKGYNETHNIHSRRAKPHRRVSYYQARESIKGLDEFRAKEIEERGKKMVCS